LLSFVGNTFPISKYKRSQVKILQFGPKFAQFEKSLGKLILLRTDEKHHFEKSKKKILNQFLQSPSEKFFWKIQNSVFRRSGAK
jgi:hypothetical protein